MSGLFAMVLVLAFTARAVRAETGGGATFEEYLKRIGFHAIALKSGGQSELLANGLLASKKRVFLVDTGWGRTTLDDRAARGLKSLGELGGILKDSYLGVLTDSSVVIMDKLTLGSAQFLNQPAQVMRLPGKIDGVLGRDFLFRNFCLIDCVQKRLYVRGAMPSDDVAAALETTLVRSGYTDVPFRLRETMAVEAKVNGEISNFLIDTGATFSLLDTALAMHLALAPARKEEPWGAPLTARVEGVRGIGKHPMWVATVKTWEVGSLQLTNVHFGVVDLQNWSLAVPGTRTETIRGLLGREMLAARGALIDCHGRKLWLLQEPKDGRIKSPRRSAP